MILDLRSDTVTRPTAAMKAFMMDAKVGDDVLGDDPTVKELEAKAAALFGHEAALFCPSGTMTNQIALKVHTNAPGEIICDELAHIYRYEGGGIGFNSNCSVRLIKGKQGRFSAEQLAAEINPEDIHLPPTQLVSLENTCNKGGGTCWDFEQLKSITQVCRKHNLPLHLDGARLFNALVAQKIKASDMGVQFDSISICLSKGLGAPVGSLLIGSKEFINKSLRIRKILGGGMRQAGFLAAAGIYALDHHVGRLKEDHLRAKQLAKHLENKDYIESIYPVETNIVIFKLNKTYPSQQFIEKLKSQGILVAGMGPQIIRMVTHLDLDDNGMEYLIKKL